MKNKIEAFNTCRCTATLHSPYKLYSGRGLKW